MKASRSRSAPSTSTGRQQAESLEIFAESTPPEGMDIAVKCSGRPQAFLAAMHSLRPGGVAVALMMPASGHEINAVPLSIRVRCQPALQALRQPDGAPGQNTVLVGPVTAPTGGRLHKVETFPPSRWPDLH